MKKLILLLFLSISFSCTTYNEPIYTEKQQKAFAVFNGLYIGNPAYGADTLFFFKNYIKPIEFYGDDYMRGKVWLCTAMGECLHKTGFDNDSLYYEITDAADHIYFYYKGGKKDKTSYNSYTLNITSICSFDLYSKYTVLPYSYNKK